MAHTIPDEFSQTTLVGFGTSLAQMLTTQQGGSNSTATAINEGTTQALSGGTFRAKPQSAVTATATIPAVNTPPSTNPMVDGWVSQVLSTDNDPITLNTTAYTVAFTVANSGWTTVPTATWTVILYAGNPNNGTIVEVGRGTSASITAGVVSVTITPSGSLVLPASPRLIVQIYVVLGVGATLSTGSMTIATGGTTARMTTGGAFTLQASRPLPDTAVATDVLTRFVTYRRSLADTAVAADALVRTYLAKRLTLTDSAGPVTDSLVRLFRSIRLVTETVAGTDVLVRSAGRFTRPLTEVVNGADALNRSGSVFRRFPTDSAGSAADSLVRLLTLVRILTDTALAADTVARSSGKFTRLLTESVNGADALNRSGSIFRRFPTDSAGPAADALVRVVVFNRFIVDTALSSDALIRSFRANRALLDTVAGTDSLARRLTLVRAIADNIGATGGGNIIVVKKPIFIFDD